jgi:hypothetical protein
MVAPHAVNGHPGPKGLGGLNFGRESSGFFSNSARGRGVAGGNPGRSVCRPDL